MINTQVWSTRKNSFECALISRSTHNSEVQSCPVPQFFEIRFPTMRRQNKIKATLLASLQSKTVFFAFVRRIIVDLSDLVRWRNITSHRPGCSFAKITFPTSHSLQ